MNARKMKQKKEKKSLRELDNLVIKRSTRFKQIRSITVFGTNHISIKTTSLPLSYYTTENTKDMCKKYFINYFWKDGVPIIYYKSNRNTVDMYLISTDDFGWWYYVSKKNTDYYDDDKPDIYSELFENKSGYVFVYFSKSNGDYIDGICSRCTNDYSGTGCYSGRLPGETGEKGFHEVQGSIFAVVIKNIAEVNALNLTGAVQSSGSFLSTALNANTNNETIQKVINDLKKSDGGATPIIPVKPNPIEIDGGSIKLYDLRNPVQEGRDNFGLFFKYKDFNVLDVISADKFKSGDRGSNIFTEFMIITYTTGYSVSFVFENGVESGILGTLDQLDQKDGIRVIRVRKTFGSFFGNTNTVGFTISFTQPYFETQDKAFSSKRLSINFSFEFE